MSTLTSVSGFPRIGANRELKRVIERYWKQDANLEQVRQQAHQLRVAHWRLQAQAGIDLIPSNDFSYYDQILDTAILLGAVPRRYRDLHFDNPEDTLFAMARGYQGDRGDVTALPMKKWFTTNYHYIVPEIECVDDLHVADSKPFDEFAQARCFGCFTKPVLIGPYTFVKLARTSQAQELPVTSQLVERLTSAYVDIVQRFARLGASWLQFDEPYLSLDKLDGDLALFRKLYEPILQARSGDIKILLNTYFGHIADAYETVNNLGFDGIGLDFVEGASDNLAAVERYGVGEHTTIVAGVINGRNIWRNNYARSLDIVDVLKRVTDRVAVSTSCSLLHVPLTTVGEESLDDDVLKHLAFAVEKLSEVHDVALLAEVDTSERYQNALLVKNQKLFDGSRVVSDSQVADRVAALKDTDFVRLPVRSERQPLQRAELELPLLPTTTIGSFPQTKQIRAERVKLRKGEVSFEEYTEVMHHHIDECIAAQEHVGLDVLVHGEFERNDMVEYFGQHLRGFRFTSSAWVQSYGTRCVKPPIIWSDVSRPEPITVAWSVYAQSKTSRIVKGMLTGPVTILNWSWPREDITHEQQAQQLALAIRDEVLDLERAGIRIIQIDEAALREKLPLRRSAWHTQYLDWAIRAFRLVHSAVKPVTQIHTHMCYSEFNDIIRDIDALDADVISFEASRADLVVLDAIAESHFETESGPGVYDIHSPRIPSVQEIEQRIGEILKKMDPQKIWINPDCGLKTRGNEETWPSLEHMVAAARAIRARL